MGYEMTPEMEEAVISLIDERIDERIDKRIEVKTVQQTRRMDRLENALVQLADAQSEAQRHISHQLYTLTNAVNNLTNVVNIMQGDIRRLDNKVSKLDDRVSKLDDRVSKLDDKVDKLDNRVTKLDDRVAKLDDRVAKLVGDSLEERYLKHAGAYFGRVLRKAKAFKPYVMEDQLRDKLSEPDYEDLSLVDLLVRGIPKGHKALHVWLAIEISVVVDRKDVERAMRRAEILRRAAFIGIPAVAGESLTQGAEILATAQEVVVVTNGKIANFQEALGRALAAKPASTP